MQCPNCKMNIKDGSQFCMHCGSRFSNSPVPQAQTVMPSVCPNCNAPVQAGASFCVKCGNRISNGQSPNGMVMQPQIQVNNGQNDIEKYQRAYFGKSYDRVMDSSFSLGVFFFDWVWLVVFGLYSTAVKLFLTHIGINILARVLGLVLGSLSGILAFGANIYVSYLYASEFSNSRLDKANKEIDNILRTTQNEEERLRLCKKASRNVTGIIIVVSIILVLVIGFGVLFMASIASAASAIDDSKKDTFMDTSRVYINATKNAVLADEIKCGGEVISKKDEGVYYYPFTTKNGTSATFLTELGGKSSWQSEDVAGQVYIYKTKVEGVDRYSYAVVLVDAEGRGIGSFDYNGKPEKVLSDSILSRSDVFDRDGDNRKVYFEKASVGTVEALTSETAPTLSTKWDDKTLSELTKSDGTKITNAPIACEGIQ